MDTNPDCTRVAAGADAGNNAGRRKLWQLESACRDSLIGSCLSARERKELCRKLSIKVQPGEADEFRSALVQVAGAPSPAARRLHKYLDRKYWRTVLRFTGAMSAAALAALWRETSAGEAADAYWALATHPHASAGLIGWVHREAHDRAGACGHAIGVDDGTLQCLRRTDQALADEPETGGPAVTVRQSTVSGGPGHTIRFTAADRDPTPPHAAAQNVESLLLALRSQIEDYAAKLALERVRAEHAEASAREWRQRAMLYEERPHARRAVGSARGLRSQTDAASAGRDLHVYGTG